MFDCFLFVVTGRVLVVLPTWVGKAGHDNSLWNTPINIHVIILIYHFSACKWTFCPRRRGKGQEVSAD